MNTLDKLLAKDYNYTQFAMSTSIDTNTTLITNLTAERDTLISTLDTISAEMVSYLENNSVSSTTTIAVSADVTSEFYCLGDQSSLFSVGDVLIFDYGSNVFKAAEVTGTPVTENHGVPAEQITIVPVGPAHSSGGLTTSWFIDLKKYANTSYITQREDEYAFTYDHLYKAIGSDGSYGVVARLAALTAATNMVTNNKTQADNTSLYYLRFTDWGDGTVSGATDVIKDALLDNTTPTSASYVSNVSFSCPGDMTSTLYTGRQMLIDCDTDGMKAGDVETSTYYPPSAGNYTEVDVVPDFTLPFLTENLISISASGSVIDLENLTLIDSDNFSCSGDVTLILIPGMDITCDCGVDGLREGWISTSTYTSDGDITTINLVQNYFLTSNLCGVYINGVQVPYDIEYKSELTFKIEGDRTSTFSPGLTGISCDCGQIDGLILCTVRQSEHKTGPCDYTLVTFTNGTETSGLPITENIKKVYIQPV